MPANLPQRADPGPEDYRPTGHSPSAGVTHCSCVPTDQPPTPSCPDCGGALHYVDTEVSSGAFRPQAASMPQMPIHYYDCPACNTCWKLGTRLLPDPIRQIMQS